MLPVGWVPSCAGPGWVGACILAMGNRDKDWVTPHTFLGCPFHCRVGMGLVAVGSPLLMRCLPLTENGYTSTDEEVSEFSLASDGR